MELLVKRGESDGVCTIGELYVDGKFECFTLEDVVRQGPKVFGETAIPAGTYKVVITYSPHFQRNLPELLDVPGFEGVRIHPGNFPKDTEGCLLVGEGKSKDMILQSQLAFGKLYPKLKAATNINITYQDV